MTHLVVFVLSLLAFAALALSMQRHQEDLFGGLLTSRATYGLAIGAWSVLALTLVLVVREQGWALGLVSYSGHTSLGAGFIFGALVVFGQVGKR
ncbi:DUF3325 family protein [Variovorax boronicumulans]|uniref:DUF3325 family protein n=1 Tax=Variovorax boronicumulans TaxID=436515 RepID=UPI000BB3E380|nr:DUF3325 family protein [Variovorax boronicumulans]